MPARENGRKGEDGGRRGSGSTGREFEPQGARVPGPGSRTPPPCCPPLPHRRYLFAHVIHDTHEARQQFSFFSSSKFLLGLLLAAFLHHGGCHPPSARFTPGARRAGRGVARTGHAGASVYQTPRRGLRLQRPTLGRTGGGGAATAEEPGPEVPSEARAEAASRARLQLLENRSRADEPAHCAGGGGDATKGAGRGALRHSRAPLEATQRAGAAVALVPAWSRKSFDFQRDLGGASPSLGPRQSFTNLDYVAR